MPQIDLVRLQNRNNVVSERGDGICLIPFDPAARNIPFGGKYKCTSAIAWMDLAVFLNVLIVNGGFETLKENVMVGPSAASLIKCGGLTRAHILKGETWRLFWSVLLHAGVIHLGVNVLALISLGKLMEPDWGTARFATVFAVAAISGNMLSACLDDGIVSVGSSGGIYGILGGLIVYILEFWSTIPLAQSLLAGTACCCFFAVITSFIPHVDIYAHLGGFAGGVLTSLALCKSITWKIQKSHRSPVACLPSAARDPFGFPYLDSPRAQSGRILVRVVTSTEDEGEGRPRTCRSGTRASAPTHFSYNNTASNIVVNARATRNSFRKTYDIRENQGYASTSGVRLAIARVIAALILMSWLGFMGVCLFIYPESFPPPGPILRFGRP